jgi:hypothetical protein
MDQPLGAREDLDVPAQLELGIEQVLDRGQPLFLQDVHIALRPALERQVRQRGAAPEREGLLEQRRTLGGLERPRPGHEPPEATEVDLLAVEIEQIAGRLGEEHRRPEGLP